MKPFPLDETDLFVLFHEFESTFLFDKDSNKEIWRVDIFGDPTCGLIGLSNEWALIGGESLTIWKDNQLQSLPTDKLKWIHDIRQIGENSVHILTDPWNTNSAIWSFDIYSESLIKVKDFNDYYGQPFTENVVW